MAEVKNQWLLAGIADFREQTPWKRAPISYEDYRAGKVTPIELEVYWQGFNGAADEAYLRAAMLRLAVSPYSPEENPFVMGPGTPDEMLDGPPQPVAQERTVPVTTRPRQLPGGGTEDVIEEGEDEMDNEELPSLMGSLMPLYCMSTGHRFAARITPELRCVCGQEDYDLDLLTDGLNAELTRQAMEGDPPLGFMDNFQPPMDLIETSDQFGVPFEEKGPKGLQDQPFHQNDVDDAEDEEDDRERVEAKVRDITHAILNTNEHVSYQRATRLARLAVKRYPSILKRADIAPAEAGVKVGDIFYSSWGYDQTNTDFYEVVGLKPASVVIRKIRAQNVAGPDNPHDALVPVPGSYIDGDRDVPGPTTKRLLGSPGHLYLKIDSRGVIYAWPWEGTPQYQTGWPYQH